MGGTVGKVLGTAGSIALGTNPLVAVGSTLAGGALQNAFSGGNNSATVQPGVNYGSNTYTIGGNPYDASKYFITGDKGVYNMLPELGNLYGSNTTNALPGTTSYNVYNSIYNKMEGDAAAQAALAKAYGPQTFTPAVNKSGFGGGPRMFQGFTGPNYLRKDIQNAYNEQKDAYRLGNKGLHGETKPVFTPKPIQYSNFGFSEKANTMDNPLNALADYAASQKNAFFVPFAPTTPTTPTTLTGNTGTTTPPPPAQTGGEFRPVNIRTGGLASLRRH